MIVLEISSARICSQILGCELKLRTEVSYLLQFMYCMILEFSAIQKPDSQMPKLKKYYIEQLNQRKRKCDQFSQLTIEKVS
jgi:hypothetical protein